MCPEVKVKLISHKHYVDKFGKDLPEIRDWKWSQNGAEKAKPWEKQSWGPEPN